MSEMSYLDQGTTGNNVGHWSGIATPVSSDWKTTEILSASGGDYEVILSPVQVENLITSKFTTVKDRFVTGRFNPSTGDLLNWEVVKGRYEVIPNSLIVEKSKAIADLEGSFNLHSAGVFDFGRKFFVILSCGTTTFNNDAFSHYLVVLTSHDGSSPITYYCVDVRNSNSSVFRVTSQDHQNSTKKRHTPNAENGLQEASSAISMRKEWTNEFHKSLSLLNSIKMPSTDGGVEKALDTVWPVSEADTTRKMKHRTEVVSYVINSYRSPHNLGIHGHTALSLYSAISEYFDHGRQVDRADSLQQMLELDNFINRKKLMAYNILASMKGDEHEERTV